MKIMKTAITRKVFWLWKKGKYPDAFTNNLIDKVDEAYEK